MEINLQTKIADLLNSYPDLEIVLQELSPAFIKLRNPVLRRTIAKVTSIQQAAKIAGIPPSEMVQTLRKAAGLNPIENICDESSEESEADWLNEGNISIRFDASPIINSGKSPMNEILRLSKELKEGEIMELKAPFRPEPIMDKLKSEGFKVCYQDGKSYFMRANK